MSANDPPRLYAIADVDFADGLPGLEILLSRLADAARRYPSRLAIQVRARQATHEALADIARMARATIGNGALLVLNGPPPLADAFGYDGVHWPEAEVPGTGRGHATLPFRSAAAHSIEAIRRAERARATAIVFSPIFAPAWKAVPAVGVDALREAAAATPLPVYALGGIDPARVRRCLAAGAYGVAVLSGIGADPDPIAAVGRYLSALG